MGKDLEIFSLSVKSIARFPKKVKRMMPRRTESPGHDLPNNGGKGVGLIIMFMDAVVFLGGGLLFSLSSSF